MEEIKQYLPEGGDWCSLEKAQFLASLILETKPKIVVEIGVWRGGSLIPMLLALKQTGGKAYAIDAWNPEASKAGENPVNAKWWGEQNHDLALEVFRKRLVKHDLEAHCEIWRKKSDDCEPPSQIDLLHVDGSHTTQAIRDVTRFAPRIPVGGHLILDDLDWSSGAVRAAHRIAIDLGFVELRTLGTGCVMRRTSTRL